MAVSDDPDELATVAHALRSRPRDRPAHVWVTDREDGRALEAIATRVGRPIDLATTDGVRAPVATPGTGWDFVVCRGALGACQPSAAARAVEAMARSLARGGWLVLGAVDLVQAIAGDLAIVRVGSGFAVRTQVRTPQLASPSEPRLARAASELPEDEASVLAGARTQLAAGDARAVVARCSRLLGAALEDDIHAGLARLYLGCAVQLRRDWQAARAILEPLAESGRPAIAWVATARLAVGAERSGQAAHALYELRRAAELAVIEDTTGGTAGGAGPERKPGPAETPTEKLLALARPRTASSGPERRN